jgi:hypothetical protein
MTIVSGTSNSPLSAVIIIRTTCSPLFYGDAHISSVTLVVRDRPPKEAAGPACVFLPFDAIAINVIHTRIMAIFNASNAVPLVFLASLGMDELGQVPELEEVHLAPKDGTRLVHVIVAGLRDRLDGLVHRNFKTGLLAVAAVFDWPHGAGIRISHVTTCHIAVAALRNRRLHGTIVTNPKACIIRVAAVYHGTNRVSARITHYITTRVWALATILDDGHLGSGAGVVAGTAAVFLDASREGKTCGITSAAIFAAGFGPETDAVAVTNRTGRALGGASLQLSLLGGEGS